MLGAEEHYLGYEVARGIKEPEHYTARIERDSVEGHEHGLRASSAFPGAFAAVRPFSHDPPR